MLSHTYKALVVGAGPGGLAATKSLLDVGLKNICWVDRTFGGGRLNELYREISSNTRVGIYLDAVNSSQTCGQIIESTPKPNAFTELSKFKRDETCDLSYTGDLIEMLEKGITAKQSVSKVLGQVEEARFEGSTWKVQIAGESNKIETTRLFLCTGSKPIIPDFHKEYNSNLKVLDLDQCMIKSQLPSLLDSDSTRKVIGVIGNSHSGILVCRNLIETKIRENMNLKIMNFKRSPIKYAIYRDDGTIINDNTGLKGSTADWAKTYMEPSGSEYEKYKDVVIEQIDTSSNEKGIYTERMKECTHLIYSIGYTPNLYPKIVIDNKEVDQDDLEFNQNTTEFSIRGGKTINGLYGLGIAHPEKTKDPNGNYENAVGLAKFFKFADDHKELWKRNE